MNRLGVYKHVFINGVGGEGGGGGGGGPKCCTIPKKMPIFLEQKVQKCCTVPKNQKKTKEKFRRNCPALVPASSPWQRSKVKRSQTSRCPEPSELASDPCSCCHSEHPDKATDVLHRLAVLAVLAAGCLMRQPSVPMTHHLTRRHVQRMKPTCHDSALGGRGCGGLRVGEG